MGWELGILILFIIIVLCCCPSDADADRGACPFTGRYVSALDESGCQVELQSGCALDPTETILSSTCLRHPSEFYQL